jgi:hypothetical protein
MVGILLPHVRLEKHLQRHFAGFSASAHKSRQLSAVNSVYSISSGNLIMREEEWAAAGSTSAFAGI